MLRSSLALMVACFMLAILYTIHIDSQYGRPAFMPGGEHCGCLDPEGCSNNDYKGCQACCGGPGKCTGIPPVGPNPTAKSCK